MRHREPRKPCSAECRARVHIIDPMQRDSKRARENRGPEFGARAAADDIGLGNHGARRAKRIQAIAQRKCHAFHDRPCHRGSIGRRRQSDERAAQYGRKIGSVARGVVAPASAISSACARPVTLAHQPSEAAADNVTPI